MFAYISQKPHVQDSPNFISVLPVDMAHSSFDVIAIRYVLPGVDDCVIFAVAHRGKDHRQHEKSI